jgi:hypothetical protein
MIRWLEHNQTLVTSLIIWTWEYEPYQVIIFHPKKQENINVIYYFNVDGSIIAKQAKINSTRTQSTQERDYHIARLALEYLESITNEMPDLNKENEEEASNPQIDEAIKETFISTYGMEIIREKHPDFGFYSLSPNLNKLEKILKGEYKSLLEEIRKIQAKHK